MRFLRVAAIAVLLALSAPSSAQDCLHWDTEARIVWDDVTSEPVTGLELFGDALYAITADGLRVYDVSDRGAPVFVMADTLNAGTAPPLIERNDQFLVAILPGVGIQVYDLSTPLAPTRRGSFTGSAVDGIDAVLIGSTLYLARTNTEGVQLVDVSNPDAPTILGTLLTNGFYDQVWSQGGYLLAYSRDLGEIASIAEGAIVRSDVRPVTAFPPAVKSGDRIHLLNGTDELITIDVSDPTNMALEATTTYAPGPLLFAAGGLVYSEGFPGLRVHDLSIPSTPVELETLAAPRSDFYAAVQDAGYLYRATTRGLTVVATESRSDSATLTQVPGVTTQFRSIGVDGNLVAFGGNGIGIVDVTDPANATKVGNFGGGSYLSLGVAVRGSTIYTSTLEDSMAVIDASDPSMPQQVRTVPFPAGRRGREFDIAGDVLYTIVFQAPGQFAIAAFDLTDPVAPVYLGMSADRSNSIEDIAGSGTRVAWQQPAGSMGIVDFADPASPVELPTIEIGEFLVDVDLEGDLVLVASSDSAYLVSYAVPETPSVVATLENRLDMSIAAVALDRDVAYVATFDGIMAYDVSDPTAPEYVGDQPVVAQGLAIASGAVLVGAEDPILLAPHCQPTGVSTLVSSFSWSTGDAGITLSWALNTPLGAADFRVRGIRGASSWDVPVERTVRGVVAVDRSARRLDEASVTYELSMRQGADTWYVVDRVDVTPTGARARSFLYPAAPNPFNPRTSLRFDVARAGEVRLTIHDAAGRRVRTLVAETRAPGSMEVVWDGLDDGGAAVASGIYLVQLLTSDARQSQKIALVR